MLSFIAVANSTNGSCPWLKQPIPCDFNLYGINQTLEDSQKLLPNTDITGTNILIMFLATTAMAFVLSFCLFVDEALLLRRWYDKEWCNWTRRFIHTIDTTLHTLSDAQIMAGLALLIVATFHASCISAYHYNVVCYLMIMSLTTHILVFVNVPEFCAKNMYVGVARVIGIIAILGLTWDLFKAREATSNFPVDPSSLFIMPASCFVGNSTNVLDSSFFSNSSSNGTANVASILASSGTGSASYEYLYVFFPVASFAIVGLIFLVADTFGGFESAIAMASNNAPHWRLKIVLGIRVVITIALACVAILASVRYWNLKSRFEVDEWYVKTQEDTASLSQIITLTMGMTSLFAALKVFVETIEGPRGTTAVEKLFGILQKAPDYVAGAEAGFHEYDPMVQKTLEEVQSKF